MSKEEFVKRLKELGYNLDAEGVNIAFAAYQKLERAKFIQ